jgi:hypothetical protein
MGHTKKVCLQELGARWLLSREVFQLEQHTSSKTIFVWFMMYNIEVSLQRTNISFCWSVQLEWSFQN